MSSTYGKNVQKLKDAQFKLIVGVQRQTFKEMCAILHSDYQSRGRKSKLTIEEKVLIMLKYYREYSSMLSIAVDAANTKIKRPKKTKRIVLRQRKSAHFKAPN